MIPNAVSAERSRSRPDLKLRSAVGLRPSLLVMGLLVVCASRGLVRGSDATPTFEKRRLSDEYWAEGASAGDFDGDGALDVVCGPWWWKGPKLEERHRIYDGKAFPNDRGYSDNFFSFVHDFSGDGRDDVLVVGLPGTPSHWYENPGAGKGEWTKHLAFPIVDNEAPVFLDLTGDGKPELVFTFEGRLGYASPGDDPRKTWEWHPISEKGGWHRYSHGLGAGDVDGDGRNDFLMPEGWWKQPEKLGGVTTWTHHPFRFGEGGATIWTDDVNGDGARDVITSLRGHGYGLSWFEQVRRDDGVATFQEHRIMASDPKEAKGEPCFSQLHAVELADIDGDGLQDIVTGKCYWAHNGADPGARDPAVLYWFKLERKDGKARYVPHEIDNDSGTGRQVTVIDLDGDGKLDVICGNKKGVFVFHQRDPAATAKRAE